MTRGLSIISVSLFIWGIGEGMFWIYQPFYLAQLGASTVAIGFALGAASLVTLLTHIPAGHLSDKLGRKPVLVSSWVIGLAAGATMALATTLPWFLLGLMLYAITGFVSSPLSSYTTNARGSLTIARALSITAASFNIGMMIGTYAGGAIGERYGLHATFIISAILFLPSTLIMFAVPAQPTQPHEDPNYSTPWASMANNIPLQRLLGLAFLAMLALTLSIQFTPKFLQDVHHLDLQQVGLLGSIGNLGNTLLMVAISSLAPRLGFLVASLCMAITMLLFWRSNNMLFFGIAFFLQGGNRAARAMLQAHIRPLVNETSLGLAYGLAESAMGSATTLAPVFAGLLYDQNPALMFPIAFAAILISMFLFSRFAIHPKNEAHHAA